MMTILDRSLACPYYDLLTDLLEKPPILVVVLVSQVCSDLDKSHLM